MYYSFETNKRFRTKQLYVPSLYTCHYYCFAFDLWPEGALQYRKQTINEGWWKISWPMRPRHGQCRQLYQGPIYYITSSTAQWLNIFSNLISSYDVPKTNKHPCPSLSRMWTCGPFPHIVMATGLHQEWGVKRDQYKL